MYRNQFRLIHLIWLDGNIKITDCKNCICVPMKYAIIWVVWINFFFFKCWSKFVRGHSASVLQKHFSLRKNFPFGWMHLIYSVSLRILLFSLFLKIIPLGSCFTRGFQRNFFLQHFVSNYYLFSYILRITLLSSSENVSIIVNTRMKYCKTRLRRF